MTEKRHVYVHVNTILFHIFISRKWNFFLLEMSSTEYISKYTNKSIPSKIYDYIDGINIDVLEMLQQQNKKGIFLFSESQYERYNLVGTYFSFENIRRFLFDSEYWSYECPSGTAIEKVLNTDAIRLEKRYVKIPINTYNDWKSHVNNNEEKRLYIPETTNIYVSYSMLYMIFVNQVDTAYVTFEKMVQYSANHVFLINATHRNIPIGIAHCQDGTSINIYNIILNIPLNQMTSTLSALEFFLNYLNFSLGNNESNDGVVTAPVYNTDPFSSPIRPFVARQLFFDSPSSERSTPTIQSRSSPLRSIVSPMYMDDEHMQTPTRIVTPTRNAPIMRTPTRSSPPRQEISLSDLLMENDDYINLEPEL